MNKNHVIIALLVVLLIGLWFMRNKSENATLTTQSNEAVQNVASVFSDLSGTITVNNLHVTGKFKADGPTQIFKGIISAWYGSTDDIKNIPSGWGLCDGTLYTALDGTKLQSPDLRSKFILGASRPNTKPDDLQILPNIPLLTPQQVGKQDGEETHTLNAHEIPAHHHTYWVNNPPGLYGPIWDITETWPPGGSSNILSGGTDYIKNQGDASSTSQVGGSQPHNNMPPYYALAYIIKL
jgi:microcystin-dependent protein